MLTRWGTVAAYAAVAGANQLLWLTYAPITTDVAEHFGVSEGAVGWLSQVFPLLYVILAIPAGLALDRAFKPALLTGAWLTAIGGAVRLSSDTFTAALAGQILIAIAQPFILNAVTKVAAAALPEDKRPNGIALGSAGIFAGTALALPLAPSVSLSTLLVIDLVVATAAALALTVAMRGVTAHREGTAELRQAWPKVRRLAARRLPRLRRLRRAHHLAAGAARTRRDLGHDRRLAARGDGRRGRGELGDLPARARPARPGADLSAGRRGRWRPPAACCSPSRPHVAILAVIPLGIALLGALPVLLELTERRTDAASRRRDHLARRERGRDRRGRPRAARQRPPDRGFLAACGACRKRARIRLKEATATPRTRPP